MAEAGLDVQVEEGEGMLGMGMTNLAVGLDPELNELKTRGYSNDGGFIAAMLGVGITVEQITKRVKPDSVITASLRELGPGVSMRMNESFGAETQMENLVLVVENYLQKRITKDDHVEILTSCF